MKTRNIGYAFALGFALNTSAPGANEVRLEEKLYPDFPWFTETGIDIALERLGIKDCEVDMARVQEYYEIAIDVSLLIGQAAQRQSSDYAATFNQKKEKLSSRLDRYTERYGEPDISSKATCETFPERASLHIAEYNSNIKKEEMQQYLSGLRESSM